MRFFLGTYTRDGGPGAALCVLRDNTMCILSSDTLENATYVILNAKQDRLFAVSSVSASGGPGGSVASYAIEGDALRRLSRSDTHGDAPCHLCLSRDERFLYEANYLSGSVTVFPVSPDGRIGESVQLVHHAGHGPHPTRQDGPHAHQVSWLPGSDVLCVVDLGMDALMLYDCDPVTGLLSFRARVDTPPGGGPRHILYGENGMAYLACEVDSTICTLRFGPDGGEVLQVFSTLPEGWDGQNTAAAIRMYDGRVWVSNRGHNSLASFRVGAEGLLTPDRIYPTGDNYPRDFQFLPDGRLLLPHQFGACHLCNLDEAGIHRISTLDVKGAVCVLPLL